LFNQLSNEKAGGKNKYVKLKIKNENNNSSINTISANRLFHTVNNINAIVILFIALSSDIIIR